MKDGIYTQLLLKNYFTEKEMALLIEEGKLIVKYREDGRSVDERFVTELSERLGCSQAELNIRLSEVKEKLKELPKISQILFPTIGDRNN